MLSLAALATLTATLLGCASEPSDAPPPAETAYVSTYQEPEATVLAPLSGVAVAPGSLQRSSLAAKIDNHPTARPQYGLNQTDIVFEELVEGGITRYVAVWHAEVPGVIGPVRSIRPMDPDIISPLGGIVAYSGGQQKFVALMLATRVHNAIHGAADTESTFYRASAKPAPHNVHVKAPELIAQYPEIAAPAQQFAFAADAAGSTAGRDGVAAGNIAVQFSNAATSSWRWDAGVGLWLRSQNSSPDVDESGAPLSATNVVVMQVEIDRRSYTNVPKTLMIGSGPAWVAAGGKYVQVTWAKESMDAPIRFTDAQGVTVRLATGNTWVELMPSSGGITVS